MKFTLALAVLCVGCSAPMKMKASDLKTLEKDQGRVLGSISVVAAETDKNEGSWAWLGGGQSSTHSYSFEIKEQSSAFIDIGSKTYSVSVAPGKVESFALKMPAGKYTFSEMSQEGVSNLKATLGPKFSVAVGQNTYIGRLNVVLPARLMMGTNVLMKIGDDQEADTASLGAEYQAVLADPVKGLMSLL